MRERTKPAIGGRSEAERALRLSLFEAACHGLMVGCGESYFLADAVRLGATGPQIGLLVALPLFLGAGGAVAALVALRNLRSRRGWTVATSSLQALSVLGIAWLDGVGGLSPAGLIFGVCLYQIAGLAAAVAWNSWLADLIPADKRGHFVAMRSRVIQVTLCLSVVGAGLALHGLEVAPAAAREAVGDAAQGRGFLSIFTLAAIARLASAFLIRTTWEPTFRRPGSLRYAIRLATAPGGAVTLRLLMCAAPLYFTAYLASPFFAPFMLEELRFSYLQFMLATVAVMVGKFVLLPVWGRAVDRYGARSVLVLAAFLVAVVPVPWLLATGLWIVIPAQMLSGVAWSGWEASYFSILVEQSSARARTYAFAAQSVFNGTGQLAGGLLGGLLLQAVERNFVILFALSALLRLVVATVLPHVVPDDGRRGPGRRQLVLRVLGYRPSGGASHRPVIVDEPAP